MTPEQLANEASRWRGAIGVATSLALVIGAGLGALSFGAARRASTLEAMVGEALAAALLLAAAALLAAWLLLGARQRHRTRDPGLRLRAAGWPQAVLAGVPTALGLWLASRVAAVPAASMTGSGFWQAAAAAALLAAFPVLVFERHLAAAGEGFREAAGLGRILRFLLGWLVAAAALLIAAGLGAPGTAGWALGVGAGVTALVATESLARALAVLFLPTPRLDAARALGDGVALRLICGPWGGSAGARAAIEARLGIDLSRGWALGFARRASGPVGLALGLVAWGLTGVATIAPDQRGIHEVFGAPRAVFGPGLHIGFPWPAGRIRRIEFGAVHMLSIALADRGATPEAPIPAEARPPASADRLWDAGHPSEASYLIPGVAGARPSFQIVDLDIRLAYRVGLDDAAGLAAHYRVTAPEAMLKAFAGQRLVRYFSTRTLQGLLVEDPRRLGEELRAWLQSDLDAANAGIDLMAVVVESIHPPPGAAAAYHAVQAAEIRAAGEVAAQRQRAANVIGEARQTAGETLNGARSQAATNLAVAEIDRIQFLADLKAARDAPAAMLLERRLTGVERGFATGKLLVIDRRIDARDGNTLDLRTLPGPGGEPD